MKPIVIILFVLLSVSKGADIFYSTGIELTNVFPYKEKNNYYSVLAGNNNVIQKKQYSQFKSPAIENFVFDIPMTNAFDSPFTELQALIINERLYTTYVNPIGNDFGNDARLTTTTVVINNSSTGSSSSSSSSIISISSGGTSSSSVSTQNGNNMSTSSSNGMQTIVIDNNASGRLNGNTLPNAGSMRENGAINAPTTTNNQPSTTGPSTLSPTNLPSPKSSSKTIQLSLTLLLIALIF